MILTSVDYSFATAFGCDLKMFIFDEGLGLPARGLKSCQVLDFKQQKHQMIENFGMIF
jgi:hypothetical protein